MANSLDIAKYLIELCHGRQVTISHLKLQKLMFYSQAMHLSLFNEELFADKILAWDHGPAVSQVYASYCHHGSGLIPNPAAFDVDKALAANEAESVKRTMEAHGHKAAWDLRNQSHNEPIWKNHRKECDAGDGSEITSREIMDHFKQDHATEEYISSYIEDAKASLGKDNLVAMPEHINSATAFSDWISQEAAKLA